MFHTTTLETNNMSERYNGWSQITRHDPSIFGVFTTHKLARSLLNDRDLLRVNFTQLRYTHTVVNTCRALWSYLLARRQLEMTAISQYK